MMYALFTGATSVTFLTLGSVRGPLSPTFWNFCHQIYSTGQCHRLRVFAPSPQMWTIQYQVRPLWVLHRRIHDAYWPVYMYRSNVNDRCVTIWGIFSPQLRPRFNVSWWYCQYTHKSGKHFTINDLGKILAKLAQTKVVLNASLLQVHLAPGLAKETPHS